MQLSQLFKSIIDQDRCAIVVCDTNHKIVYMNPSALSRYEKCGGSALLGKSLLDCHNCKSQEIIARILDWFYTDKKNNIVHTYYNDKENKDVYMVALRDDDGKLIGYYEKHEYRCRDMSPIYQMT